jgi:[pyruvate, water dikinase]-phosphate phosphotransferase / [pyruvate, water dikinase] kinase
MSTKMAQPRRTAFFLSDRTGITVEMLGHSLLRQFEDVPFDEITLPYLDTAQKASAVVEQLNERARADGLRPLMFSTVVDSDTGGFSALRAGYIWIASTFLLAR